MMRELMMMTIAGFFLFTACGQESPAEQINEVQEEVMEEAPIELMTYFDDHNGLSLKVDSVYESLSDQQRVAQLIMPAAGRLGKSAERIKYLIDNQYIGGILLLNGTKDQFKGWVNEYNLRNVQAGNLPFLFSADAEPSLVNRKITGSTPVKKANQLDSVQEAASVARTISKDLNDIGINYNFAPVVDLSPNKTVGYRGFGTIEGNVIPFSKAFIEETQNMNIIATAKHFPGHGLVTGDTHKSLQVIDGELKEVQYYPPLIENGVLSIMVAHIAVKNNEKYDTQGLPSTTSKAIVTDLLRDSLQFKGLIVTDAMGMGGVTQVKNSSSKAIEAGCDILLMPKNAVEAHKEILSRFKSDETFQESVESSVKRIIRMKICLGLID